MKKLSACVKCGAVPEMKKTKTSLTDSKWHPIYLYQVVCPCGAKTGKSKSYYEVAEDWNAQQECLSKLGEEWSI